MDYVPLASEAKRMTSAIAIEYIFKEIAALITKETSRRNFSCKWVTNETPDYIISIVKNFMTEKGYSVEEYHACPSADLFCRCGTKEICISWI